MSRGSNPFLLSKRKIELKCILHFRHQKIEVCVYVTKIGKQIHVACHFSLDKVP